LYIAPIDSAGFARSVREDTAELASYVLASKKEKRNASFLNQRPSSSQLSLDRLVDDDSRNAGAERIDEVSEPSSPDEELDFPEDAGPSILSRMLRRSPPEGESPSAFPNDGSNADDLRMPRSPSKISLSVEPASPIFRPGEDMSETTPLLGPKRHRSSSPDGIGDLESQKPRNTWYTRSSLRGKAVHKIRNIAAALNPKTWNKKTIWEKAVVDPMRCLPAVVVGLLLNILDALSYGVYMVICYLTGRLTNHSKA
jgi:sulfate permease, SulP family